MKTLSLFSIVTFLSAVFSEATLYDVLLHTENRFTIRGEVDTEKDTFTIVSWDTGANSSQIWTPRSDQFPILLHAFEESGSPHDVPSAWDGKIGDWAFLLPPGRDVVSGIQWKEGIPSPFWTGSSFGWGGLRNSLGKNVVRNKRETMFFYLPSENGNIFKGPGLNVVQVQPRELTVGNKPRPGGADSASLNRTPANAPAAQPRAGDVPSIVAHLPLASVEEPPIEVEIGLFAGVWLHGNVGDKFQVQFSEKLDANWQPLLNVTLQASPQLWIDPESSAQPRRFYRAVKLP